MYNYTIYLRSSDQGITGIVKCPDQLRALMRAPTSQTFELTDTTGVAILRVSEVSAVAYEEISDGKKAGS